MAGIRSLHISELNRQKIETLTQFAGEPKPLREKPQRGNVNSYASIKHQAKVQVKGRPEGKYFELLPPENNRGLSRLPKPTEGDIYFDIEGDPFFGDGGMEYLLGFSFMPRLKVLADQQLYKISKNDNYGEFNSIFRQTIDWQLIEACA